VPVAGCCDATPGDASGLGQFDRACGWAACRSSPAAATHRGVDPPKGRRALAFARVKDGQTDDLIVADDHIVVGELAVRRVAWLLEIDVQDISLRVIPRTRDSPAESGGVPGPTSDTLEWRLRP